MTISRDLTVKFNEVPSGGLELRFSNASGELNEKLQDILGDSPVYNAELNLKPVETFVNLEGNISGEVNNVCSRCAEEFRSSFDKSFLTAFYKSEDNLKNLSGAVNDIEGSFDLEFLEGNLIDLGEVVHEQVALELPFNPVCAEDCKGLCFKCGTNMNETQCQCPKDEEELIKPESPFAKLKVLSGDGANN